jgi:hypothetical protein
MNWRAEKSTRHAIYIVATYEVAYAQASNTVPRLCNDLYIAFIILTLIFSVSENYP